LNTVNSSPQQNKDLFAADFFNTLHRLRCDAKFSDYTLKTDGLSLPCHRLILAAASPYFEAMFTSGMEESSADFVELKDTSSEALESIEEYCDELSCMARRARLYTALCGAARSRAEPA